MPNVALAQKKEVAMKAMRLVGKILVCCLPSWPMMFCNVMLAVVQHSASCLTADQLILKNLSVHVLQSVWQPHVWPC